MERSNCKAFLTQFVSAQGHQWVEGKEGQCARKGAFQSGSSKCGGKQPFQILGFVKHPCLTAHSSWWKSDALTACTYLSIPLPPRPMVPLGLGSQDHSGSKPQCRLAHSRAWCSLVTPRTTLCAPSSHWSSQHIWALNRARRWAGQGSCRNVLMVLNLVDLNQGSFKQGSSSLSSRQLEGQAGV